MDMSLEKIRSQVPKHVLSIARVLNKEGFDAYLVGGAVRDILMGSRPKDYDIGTNARPSDILSLFPKAISTGAKFGSIIVLVPDEKGESCSVDVTTFRIEEKYVGGRWPSKVEFTKDIQIDLSRRDFTINAMAIDLAALEQGSLQDGEIVYDPFNGQKDIEGKLIRSVGNAEARLKEDALRALRACRLSSVLGFEMDQEVKHAIRLVLTIIDNLSAERVREEFLKTLYDSARPSDGLRLLKEVGILKIWIPELLEGVGVEQPEYHLYDVFEHSLKTVDAADDSIKLAALFHDIGKPETKKGKHFYGHDVVGARMTREIMKRFRFSSKEIDRVCCLVRWHMFYFPYDEEDFMKGRKSARTRRNKDGVAKWSDAAIRRFIRNVGGEEAIDELIKLRIADVAANPKSTLDTREIQALQTRITEVRSKDMAIKVTDLDINGNDLKKIGIQPGLKMGDILKELLELVIEDPILNDKDKLLNIVKERFLKL